MAIVTRLGDDRPRDFDFDGSATGKANGRGPLAAKVERPRGRGSAARDKLQILFIDPRPLTRASYANLLTTTTPDFRVVTLASVHELYIAEVAGRPAKTDIVVLSLGPGPAEEKVRHDIRTVRRELNGVPVVVLSDCEDALHVTDILRAGAQGVVSTTLNPHVVIKALKLVHAGGTFVPANTLVQAMERASPVPASEASPDLNLTPRQWEVLHLLKEGKPNKTIAYELSMQECTVKVHVRHIMKKLNASNRTQAACLANQLIKDQPA